MTDIDCDRLGPDESSPGRRTWADIDRELWLAGLTIQREQALARGEGPARAADVDWAMTVVSSLVKREFVVTEKETSDEGRLSPTERQTLWVARGVLGGRQRGDAEQLWSSQSALLELFFSQPPFTKRLSKFEGDFTAVLDEHAERFDEIRRAFGVLGELAVPNMPITDRERLLDDVVRTPARPVDPRRRSKGRTDLHVRSCMAQALLSGVPAPVVEEHHAARLFDFQDPDNAFAEMVDRLDRRIRRTLKGHGWRRGELEGFLDVVTSEANAEAMLRWGLARFMTWIRIGALPSKDLWFRARLSKYSTFEDELNSALAKRGEHEPIPEHDGWGPSVRPGWANPVQDQVLNHLTEAVADAGFEEAARATTKVLISGPAALRTYYILDKDTDKELHRCRCAVEAARYWLRIRSRSSHSTLAQLRDAVLTVHPASDPKWRQRHLPFVAWAAKEFLDAVIDHVDLADSDALIGLRLRPRLATLWALPPAVRSACDRNPQAPPARRAGVLAHAVLDELAKLPLEDAPAGPLSEDVELSHEALRALTAELDDGYGDLPNVAERLSTEVTARLYPTQELLP